MKKENTLNTVKIEGTLIEGKKGTLNRVKIKGTLKENTEDTITEGRKKKAL